MSLTPEELYTEIYVRNNEGEITYVSPDGRGFEPDDFKDATFYADAKLEDKVDVAWGGDRLHVLLRSPFGRIEEPIAVDDINASLFVVWRVDPRLEKLARNEGIKWDTLPDSTLDTIYSLYTANRRDLNGVDNDAIPNSGDVI